MKFESNIPHDKEESAQFERYRLLALISSDWYWETDESFVFTYISDSAERITGFPKEFYIGKSRFDLASEETKQSARWLNHIEQVTRREPIKNFEYKTSDLHGGGLFLRVNAIPLFHEDGGFRGYLGSTTDITELVLAQERTKEIDAKLREREFLKLALDEHAIVSIADAKGNITYANNKFCDISGFALEELLGQNHRILKFGEHPPEFYKDLWQTIASGKPWHGEIKNLRKDGGHYWVKATIVPFLDDQGKPFQYIGIRTDITERKAIERKLRRVADEMQEVLSTTSQGYWRIDNDARTIEVNPRMAEILGVSQQDSIGTSVNDYLSDEQREHHQRKLKQRECGKSEAYELVLTCANANEVSCIFSATPLYDEEGNKIGSFALVSDITELKENQKSLELAKDQAEAASRTKSDFLANMSHELRTPLNAIIGFSSTMKEEIFGPIGNDKYVEYLDDIHHSGQHLLELINDILDVSALEADALKLYEDYMVTSDVIDAAIRLIQPRAMRNNITLNALSEPEIPVINGDQRRVMQVMLNLLSNAVKYTPEGGEVSVHSSLNDDGSLFISVSDTGIGMNEEEAAVALSKFGQIDSSHARKQEGTGLGLPLTKGLMELHGGTLEIESEKGHGTLVTITFPKERIIKDIG